MANNFKPNDLKEIIAVYLPAAFTTFASSRSCVR